MLNLNTRNHSNICPTLRRGFFYALLVLVCTFSLSFAKSAATPPTSVIQGRTLDQNGRGVPYVSLVFQQSNVFVLSDKEGYFSYIQPFTVDDSVQIQRIGYRSESISTLALVSTGIIRLTPTVLTLKSVEIQAEGPSSAATVLAPLTHYSKSNASGTMDHSKLLRRIPGISIKSYGGPAGIRSLSIDGGPTSHTKVVIDGIDITSAQNGETDISQLPLPYIENMSYQPYDISHSASGGSDGVVMLGSSEPENRISMSVGSYGHAAYDIKLSKQFSGIWSFVQFGQRREDGNYPVNWDHTVHNRRNNDLDQNFLALKTKGMLRPDLFWQASVMHSRQSRGVAGLVWSSDTLSHRNDQLLLMGTTIGWIRPAGSTHFQLSLRFSDEDYVNPLINVSSKHELASYHLSMEDRQTFSKNLELLTHLSISQDEIKSNSTGRHERLSYMASASPVLTLVKEIKLVPSLKFQASPDLYEQFLVDFQIQIPLNWGPLKTVSTGQGDIYRYPSFNDLYWWPGGNPDLLPEKTRVTTAQLQCDLNRFGALTFQWQKKESTNLIQWIPGFSYWQPENIRSATRDSQKIMWQLARPQYDLFIFANLSLIQTFDQDWNERLRYAPTQTSAAGITWSPAQVEINLEYSYLSDLISMYDYPVNTMVTATELWSLSAAHTWPSSIGNITLVLAGDNLLDVSYETIRGYPEPGRTYRISVNYTPKYSTERK